MEEEKKNEEDVQPEFGKVAIGFIVAVLVLGGIVYAGYKFSQKKGKEQVLPSGYPAGQASPVDCSKPRDPAWNIWEYYLKCDRIKAVADEKMVEHTNSEYGFSITIPASMTTELYANGLGVPYKDIPGPSNLLYSIDLAASRSGEFKALKGKDYVDSYWKQFSGLGAVNYVEPIETAGGVKGYKTNYKFSYGADSPNTEIFIELSSGTGDFAHFSSGILTDDLYNRIIGSFKYSGETTTTTEKTQ